MYHQYLRHARHRLFLPRIPTSRRPLLPSGKDSNASLGGSPRYAHPQLPLAPDRTIKRRTNMCPVQEDGGAPPRPSRFGSSLATAGLQAAAPQYGVQEVQQGAVSFRYSGRDEEEKLRQEEED